MFKLSSKKFENRGYNLKKKLIQHIITVIQYNSIDETNKTKLKKFHDKSVLTAIYLLFIITLLYLNIHITYSKIVSGI